MFRTIKRVIAWVGPYKKRLYLGTLCSFLATWFTAVPIMIAAMTIGRTVVGTISNTSILIVFFIIALSVAFRYICSYARTRLQDSIGTECAAEERILVGEILKRVPLGFFARNSTGEILADLTSEYSQLELNGMSLINNVLNGYINFLATVMCLCFFNWKAAIVAIAGVLASAWALHVINRKSKNSSSINQNASEELASSVLQYIRGLQAVKAFGQEGPAFNEMKRTFKKSRKINIAIEKSYIPWNTLHLLVLKIANVVIVVITAWNTMNKVTPITFLIMMSMFAFFMFGGIEAINNSSHVLGMIEIALNKIEQLKKAEFIDKKGKDISISSYNINFKDVNFEYNSKNQILHNLNFCVKQGTTTAIVGPSGGGKTTICNLIARFYDVTEGRITIGNVDVRDFTCDSLLKNISMVFQNVYLFRDTIRNNIKFGNIEATDEAVEAAAKAARCHEFIMDLPEGYDTLVGEGGNTLSGGEKQRISIARAILKNSPVVILDEATASIDQENEYLIQQAINELTVGKTVIVIAHRLATIENADQILVVDQGRIVQSGTHQELITQAGLYKNFVAIRERAEGWKIA